MTYQTRTAQAGNREFLRGIGDAALRKIEEDARRDLARLETAVVDCKSDLAVIETEKARRSHGG